MGLWIGLLFAAALFGALYVYWDRREDQKWHDHVPNQLIVRFHDGITEEQMIEIHRKAKCELIGSDQELGIYHLSSKRKMRRIWKHYQGLDEIEFAEPNYRFKAFATSNDPYFASYQYGPQTIQAPSAWDVTQGSAAVKIAVVDTGVQLDHPELQSKIIQGYDYVNNDANPMDGNGHGTHVAGIASAVTNNAYGIAGVCPLASILPVRVLDDSGSGDLLNVARGIIFAAAQGAQVINLSLGSPATSSTLQSAIDYAWRSGAVIVAAAGNDGSVVPSYPANYPNVISVASTNANDVKSGFSNYGRWVDVAAPGENILSTYPGSYYAYLSGTSMASPHVAGLAALLASQGKTNVQIQSVIQTTSDPIPGTGTFWKFGRVNAARAVRS
ncbi:S8 family peptidase [Brevibacillus nitrificans]|uniref:S8 family peptidase n=1 Tax=Brevibacillus nitrificans TaxID=651560 RepID=UPI002E1E081B